MRGAPKRLSIPDFAVRIIPAYAGSTPEPQVVQVMNQDHPRVCGEHLSSSYSLVPVPGSSPRMRGALGLMCHVLPDGRIIPAYAGSTCAERPCPYPSGDHPRVCGEHAPVQQPVLHERGSSPRMRGARRYHADWSGSAGIIPAYAGSTSHYICSDF